MNDVLQIPMNKELKEKATKVALESGFSSLQEMVRVFLTLLVQGKIEPRFVTIEEIKMKAGMKKKK